MVATLEKKHGSYRSIAAFEQRLRGHSVPVFEIEQPDGEVRRFPADADGSADARADVPAAFRIVARTGTGDSVLASLDEFKTALAYVNGDVDIEGDFMSAFHLRRFFADRHPLRSIARFVRPWLTGQSAQNRKLIPKHYDHGNDFYSTFLDKDFRLYSQAVFTDEDETLEQAARNKLDYICDACRIGRGTDVLDIGAGWGSFSFYAAARGANVTMLTVSSEQQKYLESEIARRSLGEQMSVTLEDVYAFDPEKRFDVVTLLGVMEHLPDYRRLLKHFETLLGRGGRVYMDFSAIREKFGISTFTYSNVFEGNGTPVYMPGLINAANDTAFEIVATLNDRHSYYLTLSHWARNLEANWNTLARRFSEQTVRLFHLYLWATAYTLGVSEDLQAYRVVLQKSRGEPSRVVGL